MVQNKYVFDPYPLQVTMQRLAENLKARRLEKKLSTRSLSEMSGVPASSIQRFELKHSISLESYVKLAKEPKKSSEGECRRRKRSVGRDYEGNDAKCFNNL